MIAKGSKELVQLIQYCRATSVALQKPLFAYAHFGNPARPFWEK